MLQSDEAARPTAEELLAQVTLPKSSIAPNILFLLNLCSPPQPRTMLHKCWTILTAALAFFTTVSACFADLLASLMVDETQAAHALLALHAGHLHVSPMTTFQG